MKNNEIFQGQRVRHVNTQSVGTVAVINGRYDVIVRWSNAPAYGEYTTVGVRFLKSVSLLERLAMALDEN